MSNKPIIDSNNEIIKGISIKRMTDNIIFSHSYFNFKREYTNQIIGITNMVNVPKNRLPKYKAIWNKSFKKAIDIEKHTIYDDEGNRYLIDKDIGILAKLE